jgi:hypothetical protein
MKAAAIGALIYLVAHVLVLAHFVDEHGRFPVGSGELLNWLFGLTP